MNKSILHTRIYDSWRNMKRRCNDPTNKRYVHYGGRGIGYDPKWEKFEGFYEDMKDGYDDQLTLDRINNDLGYSKENCRWASMEEQMNNKSNNHRITINGITRTLAQWIKLYDLNPSTVRQRYYTYKWDILRSLTTPVRKRG